MKARRSVRAAISPSHDAYGQEIWNCYKGNSTHEIVERDDGLVDLGSALPYFAEYPDWPPHERTAIDRVRGPVLDIGCGAGRVALYLQRQGHKVFAIDNSPLAIRVARLRGVTSARVLDIRDVGVLKGPFASIVLYGNNFGLFGGPNRARRLLAAMHRITTPEAQIVAAVANPYRTTDAIHLDYLRRNRVRGRMSGQLRLRVRYQQYTGAWFDYLFASPEEIRAILVPTGWQLNDVLSTLGPEYVAIIGKR
jgi:SAM-dependent methyltransferase